MVRRSPCELYIKYLLVRSGQATTAEIIQHLVQKQLDFISDAYIENLRTQCVPPVPFYPANTHHPLSQRFLIKQGLRTFFHPDANADRAKAMLDEPSTKEFIEASVISGLSFEMTSVGLRKKGVPSTSGAVEQYCYFFWNLSNVDSLELKALLRLRMQSLVYAGLPGPLDVDAGEMQQLMRKGLWNDPRWLAANTSNKAIANIMHALRSGYMPSGVELGRLAQFGQVAGVAAAADAMMRGARPEHARDLALTAKLMGDILETVGDPEADLRQDLRTLVLKTESKPVPQIHQLTQGNHTTDVQPIEQKDVLEGILEEADKSA